MSPLPPSGDTCVGSQLKFWLAQKESQRALRTGRCRELQSHRGQRKHKRLGRKSGPCPRSHSDPNCLQLALFGPIAGSSCCHIGVSPTASRIICCTSSVPFLEMALLATGNNTRSTACRKLALPELSLDRRLRLREAGSETRSRAGGNSQAARRRELPWLAANGKQRVAGETGKRRLL